MDVTSAAGLIDERMVEAAKLNDVPVIAYGLTLGGELVHAGAVGDLPSGVAPQSLRFRIASMTKSFTAATVLQLRDEGLLALDMPVAEVLPWAGTMGMPDSAPSVRIAHLLTMTAGFPTDDPWGDRQESLPLEEFDALVTAGLSFCRPPGIEFEYANIGYAILGRVIAEVTGTSYVDALRERLLEPLALRSTGFTVLDDVARATGMHPTAAGLVPQAEGPPGAFSPMGGLWSTVVDIARWIDFLESAWADAPEAGPLARWSRREMQRPHSSIGFDEGRDGDVAFDSYGLGLRMSDHQRLGRFIHHSGGYPGFGSHMRWHPATRWGIIALANRTYAPMRSVCAGVLDEVVVDEAAQAARARAVDRLWPQTEAAMALAERLLVEWDDGALTAMAAMNLDMDQSRAERRDAWRALDAQSAQREIGSVTSRSPAHAHWRVVTPGGPIELDVLLTGERVPRIQAMDARRHPDAAHPAP